MNELMEMQKQQIEALQKELAKKNQLLEEATEIFKNFIAQHEIEINNPLNTI